MPDSATFVSSATRWPAFSDPRFEVVGELGQGASSRVLEVRDRALGARRAMKLATGRGQLLRLQREYTRLCELRHPNIVRAYDFGTTLAAQPYYTMELVRGTQLGGFASRSDPEVLGIIAMQLLDALNTLHARGFVHRDIKPRNVLVVGDGPAVLTRLIDLGLMTRAEKAAKAAGTLPYMAPEVARGEPLDGRADLYSLGVLLYEALLPNDTARTVEDVARRFTLQPEPPARLNPTISKGFSDFVMRLLVPDREGRFVDAEEAADALAHVSGLRLGRGPPRSTAERLLRGGATSHRTRLVTRLLQASDTVRETGRAQAFVIEAGPGMGKTPFLRELAMRLNLRGATVLPIKTGSEPSAPLPALLRASQALTGAAPLLRINLESESADMVRELLGKSALLAMGLAGRVLVLLIDDLHKADPVAIEGVRSFIADVVDAPVLVVLSGDPRPDGKRVSDVLGTLATAITLGPLGSREIAKLAEQRLFGLELPPPALQRLVEDSSGMPSLVERTLARLLVDQTVQRKGARYIFAGGRYRAATHGDQDLIAARIAQVIPEQRPILWASAVLAHEIDAASVAFIAERPEREVAQTLAAFLRVELLTPGEASNVALYKFASRSLLGSVYQSIPAEARLGLHDRAALLLERSPRGAGRSEDRVEHLLKGSDDALAVAAAEQAGDRAAVLFADRRAIEYYARAFARIGAANDPRAATLALKLGKLFARTGELERAGDWLQTAADVAEGRAAAKVEALLELGNVHLARGDSSAAQTQAEQARALLHDAHAPGLVAAAERLGALVAMQRGEAQTAERSFLRALKEFESSGDESQAVLVLLDLARLARQRGEIVRAVRYARRALSLAKNSGNAAAVAEASTVLGRGFLRAARFATARRVLLRGLRVARGSGDKLREAAVQRELGNLKLRQGELHAALERYTRGLELARAVRARVDESACLHNIGMVRARLGEFRPALAALSAALEVAEAMDDAQGAAATRVELGHAYAQVGDYPTAETMLSAAQKLGAHLQDPVVESEGQALLAFVALERGDPSWVTDAVQTVRQKVENIEDPGNRALALLYAGRASLGAGDAGTARMLAERLRTEVHEAGLRDFDAPARGLLGQSLAELGDHDLAAQHLSDAIRGAVASQERPLELTFRFALARLELGDGSAEQLTRAMEVMRDVTLALPEELVNVYLRRGEARALREAFGRERARLLGAV